MNSLYHIAILEGFLSQHGELPRNVQDAVTYFKQLATPQPITAKPKKKRKISPEHLQRLREGLNKARESKLASGDVIAWTPKNISKLKDLKDSGKTYAEMAAEFGSTVKAIGNAIHRNGI